MLRPVQSAVLPSVIEEKLRAIRRRSVLYAAIRAFSIGASVLVLTMTAAMMIDWWWVLFHTSARVIVTTTVFALAILTVLAVGIRPLVQALGWARAATTADEAVPELEERWTTIASCASGSSAPTSVLSKAMLQQVTSEAVALGRLVVPHKTAPPAPLRPALLCLASSLLVLAALVAVGWPRTNVLLQRFWAPWASITATQVHSVTGDIKVPRGEQVELVSTRSGIAPKYAHLMMQHDANRIELVELRPDAKRPDAFLHKVLVDRSFRYRVRAGDGQTAWHHVTAIDYPEIGEVRFTITPPAYVNRAPVDKALIPRRVNVVQGSRLALLLKPVADVERLTIALRTGPEEETSDQHVIELAPGRNGWYRFETQLLTDLTLTPMLRSEHGLTNENPPTCRIQVIPDKAPVAHVTSPTDEMAVATDEVIDIKFEAHDDHGIASAELVVFADSGEADLDHPIELYVQPIPLGDQQGARYLSATTQLDLSRLELAPGTNISYAVRVTDNREADMDNIAQLEQDGTLSSGPQQDGMPRSDTGNRDAGPLANLRPEDTPSVKDDPSLAPAATEADAERSANSLANHATEKPANDAELASQSAEVQSPRARDGELPTATNPDADESTQSTTFEFAEQSRSAGADKATDEAIPLQDEQAKNADNTPSTNPPPNLALNAGLPATPPDEPMPLESTVPSTIQDGAADQPKRVNLDKPKVPHSPAEATVNASPALGNSSQDKAAQDEAAARPDGVNAEAVATREGQGSETTQQTSQLNKGASAADNGRSTSSVEPGSPATAMHPQSAVSGQDTETRRQRLKITERLSAVAAADGQTPASMSIRERVVQIDTMLAAVEGSLTRVIGHEIPDADRGAQFRALDVQLGDIEQYIGNLHDETKDNEFAFAGLQMVEISRSHVTPARDEVFRATRNLLEADPPATIALQHVTRGRELLAALLERYDRIVRDQELANSLDETVKMYEVYVEKMQQLLREARQNANPLERKMAVIEVDQPYLDRFAEVLRLRRDMLSEFGRMLADDPRLLARYLDLIKRRRDSMRDQLAELAGRQEEIATELSGWLHVDESQRSDLWMLLVEMRGAATTALARDAAELAERMEKQLPLVLEPDQGTAAVVVGHARDIAQSARAISFAARENEIPTREPAGDARWERDAQQLVRLFSQLDAALDELSFEHEVDEEITGYVRSRQLEARTVADQASAWARVAHGIEKAQYAGLAEVDQHKLAIATELLRVEMLGIEEDLEDEFQEQAESSVPAGILEVVRTLHQVMEAVSFHQTSAVFALTRQHLEDAEIQQAKAVEGFERAEELLDTIRREVAAALDEFDVTDPNIADLEDPTLDEFLAQLEREPNIEAQLGIPDRPRNLRVIAEALTWQQTGGDQLLASGDAAMQRARDAMETKRAGKPTSAASDEELDEPQREPLPESQEMQDALAKALAAMKDKMEDPSTTPQQREALDKMSDVMQQMMGEAGQRPANPQAWDELAQSDQAKQTLQALARGEAIPDQQWNKLLSKLEDGLWQVRGKSPPAGYRKAIEQYQDQLRELINREP